MVRHPFPFIVSIGILLVYFIPLCLAVALHVKRFGGPSQSKGLMLQHIISRIGLAALLVHLSALTKSNATSWQHARSAMAWVMLYFVTLPLLPAAFIGLSGRITKDNGKPSTRRGTALPGVSMFAVLALGIGGTVAGSLSGSSETLVRRADMVADIAVGLSLATVVAELVVAVYLWRRDRESMLYKHSIIMLMAFSLPFITARDSIILAWIIISAATNASTFAIPFAAMVVEYVPVMLYLRHGYKHPKDDVAVVPYAQPPSGTTQGVFNNDAPAAQSPAYTEPTPPPKAELPSSPAPAYHDGAMV